MDIEWDLLHKYLADDCTDAERRLFEAWLAEAPMHRQLFHELRELAVDADRMVAADRQEALLADLKRQVTGTPPLRVVPGTEPTPRRHVRRMLRIAAVLLGTLGASVLGYQFLRQSPAPLATTPSAARVFTAPRAGRLSIQLPDGTLAELAPTTTLRLPADYGARDRAVGLVGEAAFTVTHDASRPFTVHTDRLVARDLGTRFVVREYPGDSATDVVVAEGVVAVTRGASAAPHASDRALLRSGDRARTTGNGRLAVSHATPLDGYFGWTRGRLVFRDVRLDEAAAQLQRWYDIDVRFTSAELGALRFTASFDETETANDVLRVIADALNLRVVRDARTYTFRVK